MDTNLAIQYTVVAVLILLAIAYLIRNIIRKNKAKNSAGACCGCSLADTCTNRRKDSPHIDRTKCSH